MRRIRKHQLKPKYLRYTSTIIINIGQYSTKLQLGQKGSFSGPQCSCMYWLLLLFQYWCCIGTLYDKMVSGSCPSLATFWSSKLMLLWTIVIVADVIFASLTSHHHHRHHHHHHHHDRYLCYR